MKKLGRPERSLQERFWEKVQKGSENSCWEWKGAKHTQGYGLVKRKDGAQLRAHRLSYMWFLGLEYEALLPSMFVCHTCDNPGCVNPIHMFLGTAGQNIRDAAAKGRLKGSVGELNGTAKLTEEQVKLIRADNRVQWKIAQDFGVCQMTISLIKQRKHWAHVD